MDSAKDAMMPSISFFERTRASITRRYQKLLDDVNPYIWPRWIFTGVLSIIYLLRVWFLSGWYIISYALGIYILNLLIGFLQPLDSDADLQSGQLPSGKHDEFKPFVRRLPEFKFWYAFTRAVIIALLCTFVNFLNIPVFWPILLIYFIALFGVSMKNQIIHMWKYKYVPWSARKPKFAASKSAE